MEAVVVQLSQETGMGTTAGKKMFDQHRRFLQERMDPDSGLLDKLLSNKTLSRIECDDIRDHHPFYRRNARLLDYINQKNKYDSLIGALRDTHQTHLVNYLIGNGEYKPEYGGDWPLTEKEISILDTNQESLVNLVDCSELLTSLYSAKVINGRQRETISSEPTNHGRNEVLLDILRRRNVDDYRQVVRCLRESNQSHVADIGLLRKGGVVSPIIARFTASLGVSELYVMGITMLNFRQEICVLCQTDALFSYNSPNAIRIYQNLNPFRLRERIESFFVKEPYGIGSSDEEDCFFVTDSQEQCVWKIARLTGEHQKFIDLQATHFPHRPKLTVNCNGQELLILALRSLYIFRTFRPEVADQKPLLIVQLPSDIEEPRHAVETSSGHFIILHSLKQDVEETAESNKKKQMYAVSKVTRDGRLVVCRFVPQNKTQEESWPSYLALDSDDRVFVADTGNDRVIFLDSDLSWICILFSTKDENKGINTLCYDKVKSQLIVAGVFGADRVNIYSIGRK